MQWHQLDHMQTISTLLQADNYHTLPPNFYRPHALPDAQPMCQSTEGPYLQGTGWQIIFLYSTK